MVTSKDLFLFYPGGFGNLFFKLKIHVLSVMQYHLL